MNTSIYNLPAGSRNRSRSLLRWFWLLVDAQSMDEGPFKWCIGSSDTITISQNNFARRFTGFPYRGGQIQICIAFNIVKINQTKKIGPFPHAPILLSWIMLIDAQRISFHAKEPVSKEAFWLWPIQEHVLRKKKNSLSVVLLQQ